MANATQLTRDQVPEHLTWNLGLIYPTDALWEADFVLAKSYGPKIAAFKGRLGRSGRRILELFTLRDEGFKILGKLHVYANMRSHQDLTNSFYSAMAERIDSLSTELSACASFISPELLKIKPETLEKMIARTKGLELYQLSFDELNRERAHVRSAEVEQVLSLASEIGGSAQTISGKLTDADMVLGKVINDKGEEIDLTDGVYHTLIESQNPEVRRRAFEAMFGAYKSMRNTLASAYSANVKADIFRAKTRNHPSCVEHALGADNIPLSVYDNLVATVHANLPLVHEYLAMRKAFMGVDVLRLYDLYVPLVEVDNKVSREVQNETVLAAVAPLGEEYVSVLREGYASRWIDEIENKGKVSGAYSWGAVGTPPFMLLNDQQDIGSMYTRAHESGHSMHSYHTRKYQPYPYASYTTFVAEVASITNEELLSHHLLAVTTDPKMRLYILNHQLEGIRTTLVRQTLFAEFERKAHALAEAGESLTPDLLGQLHKELNQQYYGAVVEIDDLIENEWARIPHFYNSFYVFQYATGIASAVALSRQILAEGKPVVDRYINFLKSGCSDYSMNIMKKAGVDLSTSAPVQAAFDAFAETLAMFKQEYAAYHASQAALAK